MRFGAPVEAVYDPLDYARGPYERYLSRYGAGPKEALFVGMNPGPWGMAQTGVPFGEVTVVRDWLGLEAPVRKPARLHPKRPVLGFGCTRSEVSGKRFWGWARRRFQTPERFFARFFVVNYCPLLFIGKGGLNLTPDKLRAADRERLFDSCDRALERTCRLLRPRFVFGIGRFAAERARGALPAGPAVFGLLHPSPANPAANRGWELLVEKQLDQAGLPRD
ncbi:MAG TPA: uracil-DNA glycosylase family protein [Candidatus Eisenbacteria bacterium]|nr:uracil-DNA glycosylase family protein [Candidatus Eisenbacteria bacterium]